MDKYKFIPVLNKVKALNPGENFILERSEWQSIYTPSAFLQRTGKKHQTKYSYKKANNDTAWQITRIS
jgi:hypothetical protein